MLKELFHVHNHGWTHRRKVGEIITNFLQKESTTEGLYEVEIKKLQPKRSGRQNRYYWKLLEYLAPALGYESKDSCHVMIMQECELGQYIDFRGKTYFDRKSSAKLDKETFAILINKCFEIAAFLNEDRAPEDHLILPRVE